MTNRHFELPYLFPTLPSIKLTGNDQLRMKQASVSRESVVIYQSRRRIHFVRERFKEHRRSGDLLLRRHEAVRQVTAIGQVQTHDAAMGTNHAGVNSKIGGGTGVRLNVHAPLLWVESEGV